MRRRTKEPQIQYRKKASHKRVTLAITPKTETHTEQEIEKMMDLNHRRSINTRKEGEK